MVSDTVGDFIVQLKNAGRAGKSHVSLPYSKYKHAIANKLQAAGYLVSVETQGEKVTKKLVVELPEGDGRTSVINGVKRISKPGRRLYAKVGTIHPVKFGKGHLFLSTPAGILTDAEAREKNVGGEQLFIIW